MFGNAEEWRLEEQEYLPGQPHQDRVAQRGIFLFKVPPHHIGRQPISFGELLDISQRLSRGIFQAQPLDPARQRLDGAAQVQQGALPA